MARIQDVLSSSFLAILLLICCQCDEHLCDIITGNGLLDDHHIFSERAAGYSVDNLGNQKFETYPKDNIFPQRELQYVFNSRPHMLEEAKEPIREAIERWGSVSGHYFKEVPGIFFEYAHIKISFYEGDHGDALSFGPGQPGETHLAHTFPYTASTPYALIHFNKQFKWANNGTGEAYDIKTVALHEMGHVLGLNHSTDTDSIMTPIICIGERKDLSPDDIAGIHYLYNWRRPKFCCWGRRDL